jgi:polyferredoxin
MIEPVGLFLRQHQRLILQVQWLVVVVYAALVVIPVFMPVPAEHELLWSNFRLFAQFCFWGVWWPGVMVATLLLGRIWCGLLCPEGHLTEWASRYGKGLAIPRWLRWSGWPMFSFVATTVYGQLVSVYEYPEAALLVLGGSTIAAVAVGWLFGREKRVWCRYLCPASGVFALLSRIAPQHYAVDRWQWRTFRGEETAVNCAVLLDTGRMNSAAQCHACGRCAGQHNAIALKLRSPFAEITNLSVPVRTTEALLLLFGMLGLATMAFQWSSSPWYVAMKMVAAEWLVDHDYFLLLQDNAPWWLLTHHPAANDLFTWLDGALILTYLLGGGALLGSLLFTGPLLAERILRDRALSWQRLTLALLPLAAASIILGLSMLTISHLRPTGLSLEWLPAARVILLASGVAASGWLVVLLLRNSVAGVVRCLAAGACMLLPMAVISAIWMQMFFVW